MDGLIARRGCLHIGCLGLASWGLSLERLWSAESNASGTRRRPRADHAILIFLNGGPSHLDMWDMKPQAPEGIRGEFRPISTSLTGYHLCEHLPRMAQHMHRATVIRSMHHSVNNSHGAAVYTALTGHDRGEVGGLAAPSDHPHMGAVLAKLKPCSPGVVSHAHLPYITQEGAGNPPQPGFFAGFLGRAYDPLFILKDPNASDFRVEELTLQGEINDSRLNHRRQLLSTLLTASYGRAGAEMSSMQQRALDLLTSSRTQQALQIQQESEATRERYGRNTYGQSVLLARRLIEAGTRLVTVSWAPHANATWDTHGSNFVNLKNTLLPQLDAAYSSLIDDLVANGMLSRTIVAVFGDFGRTPRINNNNGGRDHWNYCYSLMLTGGGFREGYVHGASDAIGAFPLHSPLTPADIIATMYACLGVPPDGEIYDPLQRPHRIVPSGEVIQELLA
ncbi:MAG: hypothetical protein KatS3mg113_0989 [Planctomycetaceae bacterium]|nr:MAG: hypothetical protein KatS3mg113_0989 [Planctomycetaceae bacterium]